MSALLASNRHLFHTKEIALLWHMTNPNTLYVTISRAVRAGVLYSVQKGLYSSVPLSKIDPFELGIALIHTYAYVSCETVLAKAGVITQHVDAMTFVSSKSKMIDCQGRRFRFRQLTDRFLYQGIGVKREGDVLWATLERAVADMLYFSPSYHFDNRRAIQWNTVRTIQKEMGYI